MSKLQGKLTVTACCGRDLTSVDTGKQDPFLVLELGKEKYKTKTHKKGGAAPVWNQSFIFNLNNVDHNEVFHIQAWDEDTLSNDKIGRADVKICEVFKNALGNPEGHWFTIVNFDNFREIRGRIQLKLEWEGTGHESLTGPSAEQIAAKAASEAKQQALDEAAKLIAVQQAQSAQALAEAQVRAATAELEAKKALEELEKKKQADAAQAAELEKQKQALAQQQAAQAAELEKQKLALAQQQAALAQQQQQPMMGGGMMMQPQGGMMQQQPGMMMQPQGGMMMQPQGGMMMQQPMGGMMQQQPMMMQQQPMGGMMVQQQPMGGMMVQQQPMGGMMVQQQPAPMYTPPAVVAQPVQKPGVSISFGAGGIQVSVGGAAQSSLVDGRYSLCTHYNNFVHSSGAVINAGAKHCGGSEMWTIDVEKKHCTLRGASGRYIQAQANGRVAAGTPPVGPGERWEVINHGNGYYSFKGHFGKYLGAEANGALDCDSAICGEKEKFFLQKY